MSLSPEERSTLSDVAGFFGEDLNWIIHVHERGYACQCVPHKYDYGTHKYCKEWESLMKVFALRAEEEKTLEQARAIRQEYEKAQREYDAADWGGEKK